MESVRLLVSYVVPMTKYFQKKNINLHCLQLRLNSSKTMELLHKKLDVFFLSTTKNEIAATQKREFTAFRTVHFRKSYRKYVNFVRRIIQRSRCGVRALRQSRPARLRATGTWNCHNFMKTMNVLLLKINMLTVEL